MKILARLWEWCVTQTVKVLPQRLISLVIRFLPPDLLAKLISSFKGLKIYPISIFGIDFLVESGPRDDHYLDLEKDQMQKWENEALRIWKEEVTNARIVIDVGAYLGVYSILAAKLGADKVIAIEPNPNSYKQLNRNLEVNSVSNLVDVYPVAVGATMESVSLITPRNRPFSSAAQIDNSPTNRKLDSWTHMEKVTMVTLDSILSNSVQKVSVIKIDAEGYERFVLEGAVQILRKSGPALIIEILSETQKDEIDNFLSGFRYPPGRPIENSNSPSALALARAVYPINYIYKVAQAE